jgi:hypothetical protein
MRADRRAVVPASLAFFALRLQDFDSEITALAAGVLFDLKLGHEENEAWFFESPEILYSFRMSLDADHGLQRIADSLLLPTLFQHLGGLLSELQKSFPPIQELLVQMSEDIPPELDQMNGGFTVSIRMQVSPDFFRRKRQNRSQQTDQHIRDQE